MAPLRSAAAVAVGLSLLLGLAAAAQAAPGKHKRAAQQIYVSLGDSYSVGYQPTSPDAGSPTTNGYANQLLPLAKAKGHRFRLVNFGCAGATTTSILQTPGCAPEKRAIGGPVYTQTQVDAAAAYIRAHRAQIGLITVSIGGNDVTACASQSDAVACVGQATSEITEHVGALARRLRTAAGPKVRIIGLTYPDVILGDWVLGNQPLAQLSTTAFQQLINPALKSAYATGKAGFIDVTAATGAYTPLDQTTELAPYGTIPVAVAQVCQLTYFCQWSNIHARTSGYHLIAQLIAGTLPRRHG